MSQYVKPLIDTPDGVKIDVNFLPEYIDWNAAEGESGYVKNRTHYEETTVVNEPLNITWDGNTEGLVSVNDTFYKVSDATPTVDDWAFIAKHYEDSAYVAGTIGNMSDNDNIAAFLQKDGVGFAVVYTDGAKPADGAPAFPEKGLYFSVSHSFGEPAYILSFTTTEPVPHTKTVVHKLDMKWLPDDVGATTAITLAEIDEICGASIYAASEVTF